jgi:predicted naringenin-chalcone synthase
MPTPAGATRAPSIRAIGTAVPEHSLPQDAIAELMVKAHRLGTADARRLRALYRLSHIGRRHGCIGDPERPLGSIEPHLADPVHVAAPSTRERMQLYAREAPALLLRACADLFSRPGAPVPEAVDHLVIVSCTGFLAPGLDVHLARELGLRRDVARTLVGFQGCHAGLAALRIAADICCARPGASVLVGCVELCTLHFQSEPTDDNLLANALFADGAAAALICGPDAPSATAPRLDVVDTRTLLHPDSLDHMTWQVGDTGFTMHLSDRIPRVLGEVARPLVEDLLGARPHDELARCFWAVHPGGAAILEAVQRALELSRQCLAESWDVLGRFGNMSSPTIYFVLREVLGSGHRQGTGLAVAFGPGLTVEAARLEKVAPS